MNYSPIGVGDLVPPPTGTNSYKSNVVATYGNLKIVNAALCDKNKNPVQLKGLSTHGLQWFPIYKGLTIPNMAQNFKIDIVRLAMYVEDSKNGDFWNGYMAHNDHMKQMVSDFVDDAINAGIYVIIDWHIHNNPNNFLNDAKTFYNEMSQKYGSYPNVIYEPCNEPENVDWPAIKDYANAVIQVIRANDPDNIIIVGTPNWCQNPGMAANKPITSYINVAYSLHFYAASHKEDIRNRLKDAINGTNVCGNNPNKNKIAVFVTEWGTSDYAVSTNDFNEAQIWVDLLNQNKISMVNWSNSNKDEHLQFYSRPLHLEDHGQGVI